jgi:hypothetical protein
MAEQNRLLEGRCINGVSTTRPAFRGPARGSCPGGAVPRPEFRAGDGAIRLDSEIVPTVFLIDVNGGLKQKLDVV